MTLSASLLFLIIPLLVSSTADAYRHITRRQLLQGAVETVSAEEQPNILAPTTLEPGDLATIVRRDTGARVDPEGLLIGLPPAISASFLEYLEASGLMRIFWDLLYKDPVKKGQNKVYDLDDGTKWSARTSNNWVKDGDMTWIDPGNEWTYEFILDIWRKGGFDQVLDTLGEKFGVEGLWVDGTSFIIVSQFEGNNIHYDVGESDSKSFNIIFPLVIPEGPAQLLVAEANGRDEGIGINFKKDMGVLVGGDTLHGTGNCNYREKQEFRLAIAVYFIDTNEENVEEFAQDDTAYYPPMGSEDFLLAQAGRHWSAAGNYSLTTDKGRDRIYVQDDRGDCAALAHLCDESLDFRNECLKTCKVFLDDEAYYEHLGKIMDWPTETAQE